MRENMGDSKERPTCAKCMWRTSWRPKGGRLHVKCWADIGNPVIVEVPEEVDVHEFVPEWCMLIPGNPSPRFGSHEEHIGSIIGMPVVRRGRDE